MDAFQDESIVSSVQSLVYTNILKHEGSQERSIDNNISRRKSSSMSPNPSDPFIIR